MVLPERADRADSALLAAGYSDRLRDFRVREKQDTRGVRYEDVPGNLAQKIIEQAKKEEDEDE